MKKSILLMACFVLLQLTLQAQDLQLALYEAITSKSLDNVKKVVEEFKADVNAPYENKKLGNPYPLHISCAVGDVEITKYLMEKGADPNAEDKMGQTPLIKLVYTPLNSDEEQARRVEIFKLLNAKKIDINATAKGGGSAISYAAYFNQKMIIEALLEAKAEPDARKNNMAKTALMEAAAKGFMGVVQVLHQGGADPKETVKIATSAGTFNEFTAAELAEQKGFTEVYTYLKSAKKIKRK